MPRNIVILGGGIAGLAACDAVTASLADYVDAGGVLPPEISVTLVEAEDQVGGRATTWDVSALDPAEHPHRQHAGHTPHGIHFFWHSYRHFAEWTRDAAHVFSPDVPTSTYNMWVTPPDLPADFDHEGAVVAVHVVDPLKPHTAWNPHARAILEAVLRRERWVTKLTSVVRELLAEDIEPNDWLAFLDMLFDEEHLSPQLRWGLFFGPIFAAQLGRVEQNPTLKALLGGRAPQDVEMGELVQPFFDTVVVERLRAAHDALAPLLSARSGPTSIAPLDAALTAARDTVLNAADAALRAVLSLLRAGHAGGAEQAAVALFELIVRDTRAILAQADSFDPRRSGYLKNLYKAAFSSPYSFDVATALRDIQMGHRNFQCAKLQVFDGDDAQALWNHIRARIEARRGRGFAISIRTGTWARGLVFDGDGKVTGVEITDRATRPPRPIAMVDPAEKGPATAVLPADAVVCTLLPACVVPLLPHCMSGAGAREEVRALRRCLSNLGRYANETVNLQIFLSRRIELPFVDGPSASTETPPFSISNLEGPFTILVDLSRAWRKATFEGVRFDAAQTGPFTGTGWELVGAWGDTFTHDDHAAPSRVQWPLGVQEALVSLAQDAADLEPRTLDERPWVVDAKRLTPPAFGQVRPERRGAYFDRWVKEVGPLVVGQTLKNLARLPGLAPDDADHLDEVAELVFRGEPAPIRFVFSKSAQAETKFHSSEPRLYALRPHARFAALPGLWLAGDWTRSGLNVQAMEGALVSGLQSGAAVIEALRGDGLDGLRGPRIRPDVVPNGAWDSGD